MNDENPEEILQFSRPFGNKLVELIKIECGATILDIGMGNGTATFFPAVKKVGDHGWVIGIDISEEMVRETYSRIQEYRVQNATVIRSDAQSLIFKDSTFDYVLSGFSYVYTTMEEVFRVLKKGGRFGLTTWKTLEDMEWMAEFLKRYIPVDIRDVCHHDSAEEVKDRLEKAGFKNIRVFTEKVEFVYRNEEQWWEEMLDSGWRSHVEKIENMGPGHLEKFKKEAFEGLQVYKYADGLHFGVCALIVLGTRKMDSG